MAVGSKAAIWSDLKPAMAVGSKAAIWFLSKPSADDCFALPADDCFALPADDCFALPDDCFALPDDCFALPPDGLTDFSSELLLPSVTICWKTGNSSGTFSASTFLGSTFSASTFLGSSFSVTNESLFNLSSNSKIFKCNLLFSADSFTSDSDNLIDNFEFSSALLTDSSAILILHIASFSALFTDWLEIFTWILLSWVLRSVISWSKLINIESCVLDILNKFRYFF